VISTKPWGPLRIHLADDFTAGTKFQDLAKESARKSVCKSLGKENEN